jgi:hypothetical protein
MCSRTTGTTAKGEQALFSNMPCGSNQTHRSGNTLAPVEEVGAHRVANAALELAIAIVHVTALGVAAGVRRRSAFTPHKVLRTESLAVVKIELPFASIEITGLRRTTGICRRLALASNEVALGG